jgi:hypothetical protein
MDRQVSDMSEEKDAQNCPEYKLTRAEKSLIEVLLNPDSRFWSVTKICEEAKISRRQYYNIYQKPEFVKFQAKVADELVSKFVLPTIHAFGKEAARGSYQHGKAILEMKGMYSEKNPLIGIEGGEGGTLTVIIGGEKVDVNKKKEE